MGTLGDAWKEESRRWIAWAREPGHDSFWRFHRDQFLELLPPPGKFTVDVGCGEGRLTRHLRGLGHNISGVDLSDVLIHAAQEADPAGEYCLASAADLPFPDQSADLIVSFMCLHDVDDLQTSVNEIARVMTPRGVVCIAIVHPINSAGIFTGRGAESPFVIEGAYLDDFRYEFPIEKNGFQMNFHSQHRTIEAYSRAFEKCGLVITAMREHRVPDHVVAQDPEQGRWQRIPLFLHFRLVKSNY